MTFDKDTKQDIIKRSRKNERYSVPTNIKRYNFISITTDGDLKIQFADMRQYLHLFAGVGLENLKQFLQRVLYRCGARVLYDTDKASTYQLLLSMVNDIVFKSWLSKLFKQFDIQTILKEDSLYNHDEPMQDLIYQYGEVIVKTLIKDYGFDDLQILFLIKDIAYYYLMCKTGQISEYHFFTYISNIHQLVQCQTAFNYCVNKVNIPNSNEGFYYEFDHDYIMCRDFEKLMDQCQEKKLTLTTNNQKIQTE